MLWRCKLEPSSVYNVTLGFIDAQYSATYAGKLNGRPFTTRKLAGKTANYLHDIFEAQQQCERLTFIIIIIESGPDSGKKSLYGDIIF